jgi:hypothetical protein
MTQGLQVTTGNADLVNLFEIELIQSGFSEAPKMSPLRSKEYHRREVLEGAPLDEPTAHVILIWRE